MESPKNSLFYFKAAYKAALKAFELREVPIGAVAVYEGRIVSIAYNLRETLLDPTAHAEIVLIRRVSNILKRWKLVDVDVFVTLEPCLMCASALKTARVRSVYFPTLEPRFGAVFSNVSLASLEKEHPYHHLVEWRLIDDERLKRLTGELLRLFFKARRGKVDFERALGEARDLFEETFRNFS